MRVSRGYWDPGKWELVFPFWSPILFSGLYIYSSSVHGSIHVTARGKGGSRNLNSTGNLVVTPFQINL